MQSNDTTRKIVHSKIRRTAVCQDFQPGRTAGTERFTRPLRSTGEDYLPKEQIETMTHKEIVPEESERIDQRQSRTSSDTNSQRSPIRSTSNGVTENNPKKKQTKQGSGTHPKKLTQSDERYQQATSD